MTFLNLCLLHSITRLEDDKDEDLEVDGSYTKNSV